MKEVRYWKRELSPEENDVFLDMMSKFTGDKLKYGTYTVVVHRGLIKAIRSERSVEVFVIDGKPATSPEPCKDTNKDNQGAISTETGE